MIFDLDSKEYVMSDSNETKPKTESAGGGDDSERHHVHDHAGEISALEHEEMHRNNYAHVHIRNHGRVRVRIATEEEVKNGIRYIDEDVDKEHTHGGHSHTHAHDSHTHSHTHEEGTVHTHSHEEGSGHTHGHGHTHDPAHTKKIINRFSRAIGHMQHIKLMVENGTDCSEVLIQLAAVKSAVNNIGRELLKEHVAHCIVDEARDNNSDALDMLNTALDQFMK